MPKCLRDIVLYAHTKRPTMNKWFTPLRRGEPIWERGVNSSPPVSIPRPRGSCPRSPTQTQYSFFLSYSFPHLYTLNLRVTAHDPEKLNLKPQSWFIPESFTRTIRRNAALPPSQTRVTNGYGEPLHHRCSGPSKFHGMAPFLFRLGCACSSGL